MKWLLGDGPARHELVLISTPCRRSMTYDTVLLVSLSLASVGYLLKAETNIIVRISDTEPVMPSFGIIGGRSVDPFWPVRF
eukprot:g65039.t1